MLGSKESRREKKKRIEKEGIIMKEGAESSRVE